MMRNKRRRLLRGLEGAASMAALAAVPAAVAAQEGEARSVELAAQPLDAALLDIGRQYGVPVIAPEALTAGKTAPALSGDMTAAAAIDRLLSGSGLVANRSGNGAFVIAQETAVLPDEENDAPVTMDAIIVRGQKLERDLQDVQSSVFVVDSEAIAATFTPDFESLIARIPNVNPAFGDAGLVIRGVSQNGPAGGLNEVSSNLTLTVTVDDIPLTTTVQTLLAPSSVWDTDRVEVFRGAQSTIQGRNALAGSIQIFSKDPTDEFTAEGQAVVGNFNTRQYSAAVGGPIIPDILSFRASYDHQEADAF